MRQYFKIVNGIINKLYFIPNPLALIKFKLDNDHEENHLNQVTSASQISPH
jgi:hypothetical protein